MTTSSTMKRWTQDDLSRALNARAEDVVLVENLETPEHDNVRSRLIFQLVRELKEQGLFVRSDEIMVHEEVDQVASRLGMDRVKVEARWRPAVNVVECFGGVFDGERVELPETPGAPIRFQEAGHKVTYRLAGWCERRRIWIYAVPK